MRATLVVLCGGAASRLGHRLKGLMEVCGAPIVRRVVEELSPLVKEVVVSVKCRRQVNALSKALEGLNVRFVVDRLREHAPIVGLVSALSEASSEVVAVAPSDAPFLRRGMYRRMMELLEGFDAVVPSWGDGRLEPLVAVYRRERALKAFEEELSGTLRLGLALLRMRIRFVHVMELCDDPEVAFMNINSEEDYERALRLCSRTHYIT